MMNSSIYDSVEEAARNLYLRALSDIPQDVRQALGEGLEVERNSGNNTAGGGLVHHP